ncbi:transglutaminase-like cysteine peptidase [Candidatus Pelagadaptatus aseana]|uniref:transglutaminase-like cysteine peptidase n=1 Tax=Candidatus Pelagadaptatus aseana TaxID=3120508 RepID=UPI003C6FE0B8
MKRSLANVAGVVALLCAALMAVAEYTGFTARAYAMIEARYGASARLRVERWQQLMSRINAAGNYTDRQKIEAANDFFNEVRWVSDMEHWKKEDYWATPIETLGTNAGDCEDFSIAKYFTLNELGIDNDKLRIT